MTTTYAGYDVSGNLVASVDAVGAANQGFYGSSGISGKNGCTLQTAPAIMSNAWTKSYYTTCTVYDSTYTALPTSSTNAFNQTTTIAYDNGQNELPRSVTDVNGKATSYSYSYDSSGNRTMQVSEPGETSSYTMQSVTHTSCASSIPTGAVKPCYHLNSNSSAYPSAISRTWYDGLGRAVETRTPGPDSGYDTVQFTVSNDANHTSATSVPFEVTSGSTWVDPATATDRNGHAPGVTITFYDALGRAIATRDPLFGTLPGISCPSINANATACTVYTLDSPHGSSTLYDTEQAIDPNNHVSETFVDALGRTVFTQDYSGLNGSSPAPIQQVGYLYNVLGEPTQVTTTDLAPQSGQNVTSVTASSAALLSTQLFTPYGTQLVANGNSLGQYTTKRFTGQYSDAVSGLDYYVSRYYDPVAGVFLSADTVEDNLVGINPYGYVGNNPETETDPTGQMVCFIGCGGSGGGSGGNGGGTGGSGSGGSSPSGSSPSTLLPPPSCAQLWGCKTGAWQEGSTTSSVDVSSTSGLLTPTCGTLGGFSGPSICVPGLTAVGVPHRLFYRTSVAVPVTLCVPTLVCIDESGGEGATEDATTTTSGELVGDRWFAADNTGGSFEGEGELAQERAKQGIPPRSVEPDDKKTLSILYADGETYVGKSGGTGNDILIQSIPAPARSHAEIDALNQLYADRYLAGTLGQGGEATMYVDRPPCIAYCYMETGSGAIETAMEQIGLDQLTIHYGPGIQDIGKVPYLFPGGTIVIN